MKRNAVLPDLQRRIVDARVVILRALEHDRAAFAHLVP
jgi:hypothetical protein